MFDKNLLFFDAAAITTTTSKSLQVDKTAAAGAWVEAAVHGLAGSETGGTIDITIKESDNDSDYNDLVALERITVAGGVTRRARLVQSQKKYLKAVVTCGTGTGLAMSLTMGLVTGPPQDEVA